MSVVEHGPTLRTIGQLPFRPIGDALRYAPAQPEWLVDGLVGLKLLTVLAGVPKVGKSTLVFSMLRALARGEPFLGRETVAAKTLLLSEERPTTLNEKRRLFGLRDDDAHLLMRFETDVPWDLTVRTATAYCHRHGLRCVIVDSWDKWAITQSDAENSASDTLKNLSPLMSAAASDLAVVIVHHQRDAPGRHGSRLRGSSALAGSADAILELERPGGDDAKPGDRVLYGTSRLLGTPDELPFSWTPTAAVAAMNGKGW